MLWNYIHFKSEKVLPLNLFKKLKNVRFFLSIEFGLCLFLSVNLYAARLPLRIFTSADGLASSTINYVARDSLGFLWFCTRDGLSRFDGREFANFRLREEPNAQTIFSFLETRSRTYWISSNEGFYRLKDLQTTLIAPDNTDRKIEDRPSLNAEKVADSAFRVLYEDSKGQVWGGNNNGLFLIEENGEKVSSRKIDLGPVAEQAEPGINVRRIFEAGDGSLWIACNAGVVRRLPDGRILTYPIKRASRHDETLTINEDARGRIFIGHSALGLFILQPESVSELQNIPNFSVRPFAPQMEIVEDSRTLDFPAQAGEVRQLKFSPNEPKQRRSTIVADVFKSSDGKLWIAVNNSLYSFEDDKIRRYQDERGLPLGISKIAEDLAGNLWIATNSGAIKFIREGFTTFGQSDENFSPQINSIYENPGGELFIVHGDWNISRLNGNSFDNAKLRMPENARFVWQSNVAVAGENGAWWALSEIGLYHFSDVKGNPVKIPAVTQDSKDTSIFCGYRDSKGVFWFSSRHDLQNRMGLTSYDSNTKEFHNFGEAENYPTDRAAESFAEDRAGNLWLGFYEGNIARYRNGRFEVFTAADGMPNGLITSLLFDHTGKLWIASTRDGLARVDDPLADKLSFVSYTTAQGLASNNIRSLVEDLQGNIYLGMVNGVDRLDPKTGQIKHFSTSDGLAGDFVNVAFRDRNGDLWFGTPNGLSRFEPQPPSILPNNSQTRIIGLNIAGTRYKVSEFGQTEIDGIELGAGQNNLQINFLNVGADESLRYEYKLENSSTDWSEPSAVHTITFANLAPASYKFFVRSINQDGISNEKAASISFTIRPPFWRTWQFITAIFLLTGLAVFALDRYRVKRTREVKQALDKSQESETRFRTLAETASDAIITIDEDSLIVFVNEAVEKIFGYKAEDLIGKNLTTLMPEPLRPPPEAGLDRYISTGKKHLPRTNIELPGRHRSGSVIPLEIAFGEFVLNGKQYFTGVARDISERKRAEAALQKSREERIAELQRVRSRIARDLHDDVGSSLTQIALYSEVAQQRSQGNSEAGEPLQLIATVSNELVEAMSDIVWAINPNKDSLQDLTQRMRHFASEILSAADIDLEFIAPETEKNVKLGANLRREIFLIFKESVNNIAKHSNATKTDIEFLLEDHAVKLFIKDDGRGFDFETTTEIKEFDWRNTKGGNGLESMQKRAAELGGQYSIKSKKGHGTNVALRVPLEKSAINGNNNSTQTGDGFDLANK